MSITDKFYAYFFGLTQSQEINNDDIDFICQINERSKELNRIAMVLLNEDRKYLDLHEGADAHNILRFKLENYSNLNPLLSASDLNSQALADVENAFAP